LKLDHTIAGLSDSDNLLDLTQQASARYSVHDNAMHECRCHGALVNAPYGMIDHNVFYRNSAGAVQLDGGWGQGPGATNLSLTNNAVSDPGQWAQFYGAISMVAPDVDGNVIPAPVFQKIKIENNSIENAPGPAIVATSARYFAIDLNWILNSNQTQTSPGNFGTLSTLDSILVDQSRDGTVCDPYRTGRTTGLIGIDPSDANTVVESNCALYVNH
jgi:hypothetical protein